MPDVSSPTTRGAIVIPIKSFEKAKERLASVLTGEERVALSRRTATHVVETAATLARFATILVVCDDENTASWARQLHVTALVSPTRGLNAAVSHACEFLRSDHDWILICHADIADPSGLASIDQPSPGSVTLVPDRHGTGTNVLAINAADDFTFRYGPTSLADHLAEARLRNLDVTIHEDAGLALDLDTPDDVALLDEPR